MWRSILRYHQDLVSRYFRTERIARTLTTLIFLAVLFAVAWGIYAFSYQGFRFLLRDVYFARAIQLYIYELFFAIIGFLILASALISGLRYLFRPSRDEWILASPGYPILPFYSLYRVVISSLWPVLVMALPMILGRLAAEGGSPSAWLVPFFTLILLTLGAVAGTLIAIFIWGKVLILLGRLFSRQFLTRNSLAFWVAASVCAVGISGGSHVFNMDIVQLFAVYRTPLEVRLSALPDAEARARLSEQIEGATEATTDAIVSEFRVFPTHWVAQAVHHSLNDGWSRKLAADLGYILLLTLLLLLIFRNLAGSYLHLWQTIQESRRLKIKPMTSRVFLPSNQAGALFRAELIRILRNGQNFLWLGLLLGLWLVQAGLNILMRRNLSRYKIPAEDLPDLIQSFQILTAVFFVSAFVLRFVLPAFSAERKTAWLLGSAPLSAKRWYLSKLGFFALLFGGLSLCVAFWNSIILGIPPATWPIFLLFASLAAIILSALGLAFGAVFPNFQTDDPEAIATSIPGLTFTFLALGYGATTAWAYYAWTILGSFWPGLAIFSLAFVLVMALTLFAIRRLARTEFVPT